MPGERRALTRRVAQLKTISGIFVEPAGCLLTQNELISPHGALSAQSGHDIRLATQKEMGWWRDGPQQPADWLTHRLLPFQSGLSPLLPVAHYLNQTLDFLQEAALLAWEKCHDGHNWNWKSFFCSKVKINDLVYEFTHVCVRVAMATMLRTCLRGNSSPIIFV